MKKNVVNTNSGIYLNYGYLTLPVNINIIPKIKIGSKTFYSKTGYHTSLLYLGDLPDTQQKEILKFASKYDVRLSKVSNVFRAVKKDDNESIIVRVQLQGLKKLINDINKQYGYGFVYPPTHITLFNLKGQYGIGINSLQEYKKITSKLDQKSINKLSGCFRLI